MTTFLASCILNPIDSSAAHFHLEDVGGRFLQTWLSALRPLSVNTTLIIVTYVDLNRKDSLHSRLIYCFIYKIHVTLIQVKKIGAETSHTLIYAFGPEGISLFP
jgi:hypothetical protein